MVTLYYYLSHPLADVFKQTMSGVFPLVSVNNSVTGQVPHLDITISRTSAEHCLIDVHTQAFDGMVMGLQIQ